ncbi:hypothetical protein D1007_59884 [Hordeum vulgare]|nr:hypothetical protein D1007_59884 [Hordeum vulgare]
MVMLFDLADQCSKAEEGLLFTHNDRDAALNTTKAKNKYTKRKGPVVLRTEPEQKRGCDRDKTPKKDNRLFCTYHNMHSHNTSEFHELRILR